MTRRTFSAVLMTLSLLCAVSLAPAQTPDSHALKAPPFAPNRLLVKFTPQATGLEIAVAHQQAGAHVLKDFSQIGVQLLQVPAGSVLANVAAYEANPLVEYAEPDFNRVLVLPSEEAGPTPAGSANFFDEQWYLHNTSQNHTRVQQTIFGPDLTVTWGADDADIDAPEAWDITKGIATTDPAAYNTPKIAVLDSGAHCSALDLQGKCLEQISFVEDFPKFWGDSCPPAEPACDNLGHGTFVASEAGANTDNNEGIAGAAWHTGFGAYKTCYVELVDIGGGFGALVGLCPVSASIAAIMQAATDQYDGGTLVRSQYHVISMSYGSDCIDFGTGTIDPCTPPNAECDAAQYAWDQGVVLAAGAGNNGDTTKFYPAACTHGVSGESTVIAVGATDHDDDRASFSTYSNPGDDWVALAAPGQDILGVLPDYQCEIEPGTDTCVWWWDGTSMSTPLVAAGAALVWSDLYQTGVDAGLAPADCMVGGVACNQVVRQRLETGADKVGAQGQDLLRWTRHGRLNIAAALGAVAATYYTLDVTTSGDGAGAVSSNPAGINCGGDCTEDYPETTEVTLTAAADAGSSFTSWGGGCTGTNNPTTVTMDADKTCDAVFTLDPVGDLPPTAAFSYSCTGLACSFDGSASSDDNGIDSYTWDFGEPGGITDLTDPQAPTHIFSAAATYEVTLIVTDAKPQGSVPASAFVTAKNNGKTKGSSDGGDTGGGGNCPPAKAAQGKC